MRFVWLVLATAACSSAAGSGAGAPRTRETVQVAVGPQATMDITRDNDVRMMQVAAARARVWSALMATHDAIGTAPSVIDAGAGTASFLHQNSKRLHGRPLSAYVDCGRGSSGPRADIYGVTLRVNHVLRADGSAEGATTVYTVVNAWAKPVGMTGDAVQCQTTGALEKKIAEILQIRLQS